MGKDLNWLASEMSSLVTKMTNQKLAAVHGISAQAVGRWSLERKRRAIIEAEAGVSPEVKRLIGELAGLCYAVQTINGVGHQLHVLFDCFYVTCGTGFLIQDAPLNALALQGEIAKLEELVYG